MSLHDLSGIKAWPSDCTTTSHRFLWEGITYQCPNFNSGRAKLYAILPCGRIVGVQTTIPLTLVVESVNNYLTTRYGYKTDHNKGNYTNCFVSAWQMIRLTWVHETAFPRQSINHSSKWNKIIFRERGKICFIQWSVNLYVFGMD